MKTQRFILIVLASIAILQITYYYPQLPEAVASHFDGAGNPNGCLSKGQFIGIYAGIIILIPFFYTFLPPLIRYVPMSLISLPKRDYWLAPERREGTFLFISEKMLVFGNATFVFLILTFQLVFEANLTGKFHLSSGSMFIFLGGYLIFVVIWLIRFISRFFKNV